MLSRDQILRLDDLPRQEVHVPEWGGSIFVRALNGAERDRLERLVSQDKTSRAAIAAMVCVDEAGNRLFEDKDVDALSKKNGAALEKIVSAAFSFNAISEEGIDDAGNV